nr:heavy metal translocating P-type ATPase [Desulfolucanica intricata]
MIYNSTFIITGLDCADCAAELEHQIKSLNGVYAASLNFGASKLLVEHSLEENEIIKVIRRSGYNASAAGAPPKQVTTLKLCGLDCADCAAKLEKRISSLNGVEKAQINFGTAIMIVHHAGPVGEIIQAVKDSGYTAQLLDKRVTDTNHNFNKKTFLTILSGIFLGLGFSLNILNMPNYLVISAYLMAILTGGFYTARSGLNALKSFSLDINFLMTVAVIGAVAIGEWSEGATVVFLFSLGNALQAYTMEKTRGSIRALMELSPREALVRRNGKELLLPVNEIVLGDIMIVKPGEKIALDGRVITGFSNVNQAPITGESVPVEKRPGMEVYAGTINEQGSLEIEVTKLEGDTTLAKIINLVEEAQAQRAPSQQFIDIFARYYTPFVIIAALAIAVIFPAVLGQPFVPWFKKALILLVISCPCALVISTPVSIVAAIGSAARRGVLIKGGACLEETGTLKAVAFDKTGTLTGGKPEITDILPVAPISEEKLLELAASVETRSQHPMAEAILRFAGYKNIKPGQITDFQSYTGLGASAKLAGETYYIGNRHLFNSLGEIPQQVESLLLKLQKQGKTAILIGSGSKILGIIAAADRVRTGSKEALRALKQAGIKHIVLLTGDNKETARAVAGELEVENFRAELLPQDKLTTIKSLQDSYGKVAMVGDGINDAPALATASVGIAMGGTGTDTAMETADIVLMADDLNKLSFAINLSRRALKIIKQNIAFAILLKLAFITATFLGFASLWMAVFADTGAALLVILNGMRLIRVKE